MVNSKWHPAAHDRQGFLAAVLNLLVFWVPLFGADLLCTANSSMHRVTASVTLWAVGALLNWHQKFSWFSSVSIFLPKSRDPRSTVEKWESTEFCCYEPRHAMSNSFLIKHFGWFEKIYQLGDDYCFSSAILCRLVGRTFKFLYFWYDFDENSTT